MNASDQPPEVQRERLLAGVANVLAERGYSDLTIERILELSGASRETFAINFTSKEAAVEAAMRAASESFFDLLLRACSAQQEWPLKVKVAVGATLDYAAAAPAQVALLNLNGFKASPGVASQTTEIKDQLASLLAGGRRYVKDRAALPVLTEQAIVGGILGVISSRLEAGEAARLPDLAPQLVEFALLPYLGREEAARIASRPSPRRTA
ncbi:MAG TPA: TetR/AcrR family transcriptional regulator [Solirubrobacterales bacterium]|jgi:AcrR family transcriptional regulator|nr:TetR/AcrR family transcriptional regulator [Solirubrobacterales bacterium]